jgi:hypothetical protein
MNENLLRKKMMLLHNEHKDILKQKVKMDVVFQMLMIVMVKLMHPFVNDMEWDSKD